MNILYYIFFITNIHITEPYFIQNQNQPICSNCKFFIPTNNGCKKYGKRDIITGETTYETAISVRNDDKKCGTTAIFYEKNYIKFITIPYYFTLDNPILFIGFFPYIMWFIWCMWVISLHK
jgi:hypothetical protein